MSVIRNERGKFSKNKQIQKTKSVENLVYNRPNWVTQTVEDEIDIHVKLQDTFLLEIPSG